MEKIISSILDFVDKHHHQRAINKVLVGLELKTIVDIGAHKGEFLMNIISLKKKVSVYCFEPQSKIFKELKNNFKKKKNVFFYNLAISNVIKDKRLNINIKTSTSTFSDYNENSYWKKIKDFLLTGINKSSIVSSEMVKSITLDKFSKNNNIRNIDLLKIDTEGHELEVLLGSKNLLKKNVNYILIEFHFSKIYKNYNRNKIEKILKSNNFILIKKFKFPFLTFEDRIYKKHHTNQ